MNPLSSVFVVYSTPLCRRRDEGWGSILNIEAVCGNEEEARAYIEMRLSLDGPANSRSPQYSFKEAPFMTISSESKGAANMTSEG